MITDRPKEGLKMVIWRITGNEIGFNSAGARFFTTKAEADRARRQANSDEGHNGATIDEPERRNGLRL